MGQDLALHLHELGSGLDAELVVEQAPGASQRCEGVRLPPTEVERGRSQRPEGLVERVRGQRRLEVGQGGLVVPQGEKGAQPAQLGLQPLFLEAGAFVGRERRGVEVGERGAAPLVQGSSVCRRRTFSSPSSAR